VSALDDPAPDDPTRHLPAASRVSSGDARTSTLRELLDRFGLERSAPRATLLGTPAFGRYLRPREIARGGMGVIYEAQDPDLGRTIALKVLDGGLDADPEVTAKFLREARITGQLDHPNIVPVHELGLAADGELYFSMKRIEGRSLAVLTDELRDVRPRRQARLRLLGIFLKVCDAVRFAHARGVIHRDLKPANILVGQYGEVYVCDWGIAKIQGMADLKGAVARAPATDAGDGMSTQDGTVMGTPQYMPPEQAMGEIAAIDTRSDIYSLGAILYTLATYERPFASDRPTEVIERAAMGAIEPPSTRNPDADVPRELEAVILKAMAREPKDRYPTVGDLAADVEAFLAGRTLAAVRYSLTQRATKWASRHKLAVAAAIVICLVGAGGHLANQRRAKLDLAAREARQLDDLAALGVALARDRAMLATVEGPDAPPLVEPSGEPRAEALARWCEAHGRLLETLRRIAELARRAETEAVRAACRAPAVDAEQRKVALAAAARSAALGETALALLWVDRAGAAGLAEDERQAALASIDAERRRRADEDVALARALLARARETQLPGFFEQAVSAMVRRKSPDLVRLLLDPVHLESASELERELAIEVLGRLGDTHTRGADGRDAVERLVAALAATDPGVHLAHALALARALGFLGDARAYVCLRDKQRAAGPESVFAQRSASALREIPLPSDLPAESGAASASADEALFERAQTHLGRGEVDLALPLLVDLDARHPDRHTIASQLGYAWILRGEFERARAEHERAVRLAPDVAAYRANLGEALRRLGRFAEAETQLDRAIALAPELAPAWMRRGQLKSEVGRAAEALLDLDRALELAPRNALVMRYRGSTLVSLGRNDEAVRTLDAALGIDPNDAHAYLNRGSAHHNLGNHELALADYSAALRIEPTLVRARVNRAITLLVLGKLDEAHAEIERAVAGAPEDAEGLARRAQVRWARGDRAAAVADVEAAMARAPRALWILTIRAELAVGQRDSLAMEATYAKAIALAPESADVVCGRGNARYELGNHDGALADFEELVRRWPGLVAGYVNRAVVRRMRGQLEPALADLDHALQLDPKRADAHRQRAITLIVMRRTDEALVAFDRVVELAPRQAGWRSERGSLLAQLGRFDQALADFATAIRLEPLRAEFNVNHGEMLMRLDRAAEALADYEQAVTKNPALWQCWSGLAVCRARLGKGDLAREALAQARARAPDDKTRAFLDGVEAQLGR